MVWSLCVLALPIGVIGGNFTQVWEEYDRMKQQEAQNRKEREALLKRSLAWSDPLYYGKQLLLEVWHDSGLPSDNLFQSEFLGEVEYMLEMGPHIPVTNQRVRMPLSGNPDKANRKVKGFLTFEYSWTPHTMTNPDALIQGKLHVRVIQAEKVVSLDPKGPKALEPYCIVIAHPRPPNEAGQLTEVMQRTRAVVGTASPWWDEVVSFSMCWTKAESDYGMVTDMKSITREDSTARNSLIRAQRSSLFRGISEQDSQQPSPRGSPKAAQNSEKCPQLMPKDVKPPEEPTERKVKVPQLKESRSSGDLSLEQCVPALQEEVSSLRVALPQLQTEISSVKKTMQLVMQALEKQAEQCCCGGLERGQPLRRKSPSLCEVDK